MLIYYGTKNEFNQDVRKGIISDKIVSLLKDHYISSDTPSAVGAFKNSLRCMSVVLENKNIDDRVNVAVEFQIPLTGLRVDCLVSGKDHRGNDNAVIVELKQWQDAEQTLLPGVVTTMLGGNPRRATNHPSYQAYSYATTIKLFNQSVYENNIGIYPCAFLHNFPETKRSKIDNDFYRDFVNEAPLFLENDIDQLSEYIQNRVSIPDGGRVLNILDKGKIKPAKALQDALLSMINGKEEFVMLREQKVAFETVKALVETTRRSNKKYTVIIQGGPGTGKSVVAINLLCKLSKYLCCYTTKNAAPKKVFAAQLRNGHKTMAYINALFKGAGSFIDTPSNTYDCILADEAHRLVKKMMFHGENQVKEIINAARVSVFFLDEDQRISDQDIGSIDEIKKWADHFGSTVKMDEAINLKSQFRCNGSDGYLAFLDDVLEIRETANKDWFDINYDLRVYENPCDMKRDLKVFNDINNKSRMIAGYCYPWISKNRSNDDGVFDIEFPCGFKAKWNFADGGAIFALDKNSFEQVGCIHTTQGLEFDYVGIIIGNDMRYENGHIVTDVTQRAPEDMTLRKRNLKTESERRLADTIIKNTYRTLLSRGQKGCYIFCQDQKLGDYLKNRITQLQRQNAN